MKTRIKKGIAAATAVIAASTAIFLGNTSGASAAAPSLPAFGLVANGTTMSYFQTNRPTQLDWVADIVGFTGCDTRLVGVDIRPKNGVLYGVGDCPTYAGIYTIPVEPAPGDGLMHITRVGQLSVALNGTSFGVDFNPVVDRLRIVSDNGQNLRHDVDLSSTIADMPLTLNGAPAKGITAVAYTNNDNDNSVNTFTTLFTIDTLNGQVAIQAPANNGTQNPTGKLGGNFGLDAGADFFSDLSGPGGRAVSNTAFATLKPPAPARQSFYMFDPLTGAATLIGAFPSLVPVTDVAVWLDTNY